MSRRLRSAARRPLGLRREVAILVPVSLVLLLVLAAFTLFSYRDAVDRLLEERRREALRFARAGASELSVGGGGAGGAELAALRRAAPVLRSLVLVDAAGRPVAVSGEVPPGAPLAPFGGTVEEGVAVGPGERVPGAVAAAVPVLLDGRRHVLRVDLEAAVLAARARALPVLTTVVLVVSAGVVLLLVLFLRHLMAPWDSLLERARALEGAGEDDGEPRGDELKWVLRTFDRGVAALLREGGGEEGRSGDVATLLVRLGEMAAGVAHELRNSLGTLRGYLTLLDRRPGEEAAATYLDEMRQEADHLERVLDDFLTFARPGTARVEEVRLETVARRAAADPALEAAVTVDADPAAPPLTGDPQLLERAVRNLLRNAVEAQRDEMPEGGPPPVEVGVRATAAGGSELVVADRGGGVPPELAGRLFHPFVTGRPGGVGLGLALAQRIAVLHGGTLRLEPRSGGGTRAVLRFPPGNTVTEGNGAVSGRRPT